MVAAQFGFSVAVAPFKRSTATKQSSMKVRAVVAPPLPPSLDNSAAACLGGAV
jgi:hypothetical protein